MTVRIFAYCLLAGAIAGILDAALIPLRRSAGRVFTVLSDVCLAFLTVGAHFLILYFLCNGRFFFYAAAAQALGFIVLRALAGKPIRAVMKALPQKKKKGASPLA
ncbi:MAG: hypothetical protein K2L51_07165 [Clostridiales bacterium]|nr:hypothetical protein [Clostridiales bacterium]